MNVRLRFWLIASALAGTVLWAYWTTVGQMAERWVNDPQYSHGYFVPLFAALLLWVRRDQAPTGPPAANWWGVLLLLPGIALWAVGTYYFINFLAGVSLLCCLAGLALVLGGRPALKWSWPSIVFLAFMVPLPYRLQTALGGGLQRIATAASAYALQTLGAPAIQEGNTILINDVKIGVVEACNGLGMLVTFFALSTAIAMLLRSADLWMRVAMVVSAVPVAILANVVRITVTGLLYAAAQDRLARIVFHDVAGWLMMPLAIGILLLELYILRRAMTCPAAADERALVFGLSRIQPGRLAVGQKS